MRENKNPKISVIIPVYNTERYIRQCIESVIKQTLADIEIIIVSDASTDHSMKIAESYQQSDNRLKLIYNEDNVGIGATRNIGLMQASGECMYFIDSDDWIEPNALEMAYKTIKRTNAQFVEFGYRWVDEEGGALIGQSQLPAGEKTLISNEEWLQGVSTGKNSVESWDKLFDAEWMKNCSIGFDDTFAEGDGTFYLKLYQKSKKIATIPEVLYNYRVNYASYTYKPKDERYIKGVLQYMQSTTEILAKENLLLSDTGYRILKGSIYVVQRFIQRSNLSNQSIEETLVKYAKDNFKEKYPFVYFLLLEIWKTTEDIHGYFDMRETHKNDFQNYRQAVNVIEACIKTGKLTPHDKIVIYGTANWGELFSFLLTKKGFDILAFADSDQNKWNKQFGDREIIPPEQIKSTSFTKILIASSKWAEIREGLLKLGHKENDIIFSEEM